MEYNYDEEKPVLLVTGATGMVGMQIATLADAANFKIIAAAKDIGQARDEFSQNAGRGSYYRWDDELDITYGPEHTDPKFWEDLIDKYKITHISESSAIFSGDADYMDLVNYQVPLAIATAARNKGIKRYIQFSSYNATNHEGNALWDSYAKLRAELQKMTDLSWVELMPGHIYTTRPHEKSHIPYAMVAALPVALYVKDDSYMQPILAHDLARGAVNLLLNDKATHQSLAAIGPEPVHHNEFWATVREGLRIPTAASSVTVSNANAVRIAYVNSLFRRISPFPKATASTIKFNIISSQGDHLPFEEATGVDQNTMRENFARDRETVYRHLVKEHPTLAKIGNIWRRLIGSKAVNYEQELERMNAEHPENRHEQHDMSLG